MKSEELRKLTYELVKQKRIPINGGIEILSNCNFRCVHCCNKMEPSNYMTYDFASQLAEQLEKLGTMHIYLTGGEVLLHPNFSEIFKCFRKKGIAVSILTNISLLNEKYIKLFENYTPYNIDISLYGSSNKTYEAITGVKNVFDIVKENIYKLSEKNIPFSLKTVAIKENFDDLQEMMNFSKKVGKVLNIYTDIRPLNNGSKQSKLHQLSIDQIIEVEKKINKWIAPRGKNDEHSKEKQKRNEGGYLYFCEIGKYTFFITHQGILHGCVKERIHGYDLNKVSFAEGFEKMLEDFVLKKSKGKNKCATCKYIKYCDYCPAQFELETGCMYTPPKDVCDLAYNRYLYFNHDI